MIYRIATIGDASTLARMHLASGKRQPGGFMHILGLRFLKTYYRVHLKEKNSFILFAIDENDSICGFVSGTLSAEEHMRILRRNFLGLAFSTFPKLLLTPQIIHKLKERYYFIVHRVHSEEYGVAVGCRIDYWAWDSECKSKFSIFLFKKWLEIAFSKGVDSVKGEVDLDNRNVLDMLIGLGARIIKEIDLSDGRKRFVIEFISPIKEHTYILRNMLPHDLLQVVEIHEKAFKGFFLTLLGDKFLYYLYKSFIDDHLSICLVAEKNSVIKGFVVGNMRPDKLFRKMLFTRGYLFLFYSIRALFVKPLMVVQRLIYALQYRGEHPQGFKQPALLSSIGVNPDEGAHGIGSLLANSFCQEAFLKGADAVYLTTDKFGNDPVNAFYIKNGFRLLDVIEKTKGRKMNRYILVRNEKTF